MNKKVSIALAGYANVGKSVIFNHLTGLHQHVGNWSGKTVTRAEGSLYYNGYDVNVIDLPGIISLTAYSEEELVAREYIIDENPQAIINVIDASNLETNLILTLQLLELERPMVLALNMIDVLERKNLAIDQTALADLLGISVRFAVATKGKGISEMLDVVLYDPHLLKPQRSFWFGAEIEKEIQKITDQIVTVKNYPKRFLAIKLLEKDHEINRLINESGQTAVLEQVNESIKILEQMHGHDSSLVIADERAAMAHRLVTKVLKRCPVKKVNHWQKFEDLTTDKVWGYLIIGVVFFLGFGLIFSFTNWLGNYFDRGLELFTNFYRHWMPEVWWSKLLWSGLESGYGLVQVSVACVLPLYFLLYFLEDVGYFARVAFLMDPLMHKLGVHGKACIPMVLGFGCNVPACLGCRIMETARERFLTGLMVSFIPCGAVTIVLSGISTRYLGTIPTVILYGMFMVVTFLVGLIAKKILPGQATELIMRMPEYRWVNFKTVGLQTWLRFKEFIFLAAPFVIILGIILSSGQIFKINHGLAWLTRYLGLPFEMGILFLLMILRRELILVMLGSLLGTPALNQVLTAEQLFVIATFTLFSPPCVATLAAFGKEFGWKYTIKVLMVKLSIALFMVKIAHLIWPWVSHYVK